MLPSFIHCFNIHSMKTQSNQSTILVITVGFVLVFLLFSWQWALYISLGIGVSGLISDRFAGIIVKGWEALSKILSYIIPTVLLAAIFYLFLLPLSILSRFFTKDPLMLSKGRPSYFVDIKNEPDHDSFKKTW